MDSTKAQMLRREKMEQGLQDNANKREQAKQEREERNRAEQYAYRPA